MMIQEIYEGEIYATTDTEFAEIFKRKKSAEKIQLGIHGQIRYLSGEENDRKTHERLAKFHDLLDFFAGDIGIDLKVLENFPKLKKLELFYAYCPTDETLNKLINLETFHIYEVFNFPVTNVGFQNFKKLKHLELLIGCDVDNMVFIHLPALRHLGLQIKGNCKIDDDFCDYIPNLRSLLLIDSPAITGKNLYKMKKLKRLEIRDKILNHEYIMSLKNLRTLKFRMVNIDPKLVKNINFSGLAKHKTLETLDLQEFCCSEKFYEIGYLKNIKCLILPEFWILRPHDDKPTIDLNKKLSTLRQLKMISLTWGIKVETLMELTNLEFLADVRNVNTLAKLPNLKYVTMTLPDDFKEKFDQIKNPLTVFYHADSYIIKIPHYKFKYGIHTFIPKSKSLSEYVLDYLNDKLNSD